MYVCVCDAFISNAIQKWLVYVRATSSLWGGMTSCIFICNSISTFLASQSMIDGPKVQPFGRQRGWRSHWLRILWYFLSWTLCESTDQRWVFFKQHPQALVGSFEVLTILSRYSQQHYLFPKSPKLVIRDLTKYDICMFTNKYIRCFFYHLLFCPSSALTNRSKLFSASHAKS